MRLPERVSKVVRAAAAVAAGTILVAGLTACGVIASLAEQVGIPPASVAPSASATRVASDVDGDAAALVAVIDGDTVKTDAGTVRIIGIDTPERDECGYDEASALLRELLAPGDPLTLQLPPGQNAEDRYGRLLRHVFTADGVDVALRQLEAGLAVARYDSTDGYPEHPYEREYHAAEAAAADAASLTCGRRDR